MALLPLKSISGFSVTASTFELWDQSCAQAEKKEHDRRMKERAQAAVVRTGNKKPSSETLSNHNMGIPTNHPSN
jgi:hypothetical protein